MSERIGIRILIAVLANRAGVGGIALLFAGGLGYNRIVIVSELFFENLVTNSAYLILFAGCLCTVLVSERSLFVADINISAIRAGIGGISALFAGGRGYSGFIAVSDSVNIFCFIFVASRANTAHFALFFTCGGNIFKPIAKGVSQCVKNVGLDHSASAAGSLFGAGGFTGGVNNGQPFVKAVSERNKLFFHFNAATLAVSERQAFVNAGGIIRNRPAVAGVSERIDKSVAFGFADVASFPIGSRRKTGGLPCNLIFTARAGGVEFQSVQKRGVIVFHGYL